MQSHILYVHLSADQVNFYITSPIDITSVEDVETPLDECMIGSVLNALRSSQSTYLIHDKRAHNIMYAVIATILKIEKGVTVFLFNSCVVPSPFFSQCVHQNLSYQCSCASSELHIYAKYITIQHYDQWCMMMNHLSQLPEQVIWSDLDLSQSQPQHQ